MAQYPKDAYYPASMALRAVETRGNNIVKITVKPKETRYKGGIFLNINWNIASDTHGAMGRFTIENFPIERGACNVNDPTDPRVVNQTEKSLSFTAESLGTYGKFIGLANVHVVGQLTALKTAGSIKTNKVNPIIRTHYSDTAPREKAGLPLDAPMIDIQLDWSTYPAKYYIKELAGTPKMLIYDADKPELDVEGCPVLDDRKQPVYKLATVEIAGKDIPVCRENAHLFVTNGSHCVRADVTLDTCFVNSNQASVPHRFTMLLIRKGTLGAKVYVEDPDQDVGLNQLDD